MIRWTTSPLFFLFFTFSESSGMDTLDCLSVDKDGNTLLESSGLSSTGDTLICDYAGAPDTECVYDLEVSHTRPGY
jgi:hypothetical protein